VYFVVGIMYASQYSSIVTQQIILPSGENAPPSSYLSHVALSLGATLGYLLILRAIQLYLMIRVASRELARTLTYVHVGLQTLGMLYRVQITANPHYQAKTLELFGVDSVVFVVATLAMVASTYHDFWHGDANGKRSKSPSKAKAASPAKATSPTKSPRGRSRSGRRKAVE
jgi:hypothetical protein